MEIFRKAASVKTYESVKEADVASLKTVIDNLNIDWKLFLMIWIT